MVIIGIGSKKVSFNKVYRTVQGTYACELRGNMRSSHNPQETPGEAILF